MACLVNLETKNILFFDPLCIRFMSWWFLAENRQVPVKERLDFGRVDAKVCRPRKKNEFMSFFEKNKLKKNMGRTVGNVIPGFIERKNNLGYHKISKRFDCFSGIVLSVGLFWTKNGFLLRELQLTHLAD